MNHYISFIGGLVIGGAVGALVTKQFVKKTYFERAKKQIDEVVEYYRGHSAEKKKPKKPVQPDIPSEPLRAVDAESLVTIDLAEKPKTESTLEVISIEDYCYAPGFTMESFTLYGDGVITNEADIPLSETQINRIFGPEIFDQICQCEDSSIYVRDPIGCIDYEIDMCPTEFTG